MGQIQTDDGIILHYEEYGTGERIVLSAQAGLFYPKEMQQALAARGYHVFCMTLRGFAPSSYVTENYGESWYDVFAGDVICLAGCGHNIDTDLPEETADEAERFLKQY